MHGRVALIGMMATGKSAVGRQLAVELECPFFDLDTLVESFRNETIPIIFREHGEAIFRQDELSELTKLSAYAADMSQVVLATGGGVITTASCRTILREQWHTVWLDASVETILSHLDGDPSGRPMLEAQGSLRARLNSLLETRRPWYQTTCSRRIDINGRTVQEIVQEIVEGLRSSPAL